jgi:hypothetical protein
MKIYDSFENLPERRGYGIKILTVSLKDEILKIINDIDWSEAAFCSTNGAFNLRFDLIEKALIENGIKNKSNGLIERFIG